MCNMSPKAVKILVTLIVLGVIGGISVVVYFVTAQSNATVNVQGEHAQSKLSQSSGIHLLEFTNQGDGSKCEYWSISDYAVIVLTFIVLLKMSHLLHYFCLTRKLVKKGVLNERQKAKTNQEKLELAPVDRILVPAL